MVTQHIEDIELDLLLEALRRHHCHDFGQYARPSLLRRLQQAQKHFNCSSLSALQEKVLHEPGFFYGFLDFLTVQVSEMFRDPDYFLALRNTVIPHLKTYPSLKVWVAGCATGEELYSLAILFREEGLEDRTIFYATDISSKALQQAEAGIYDLRRIASFTENYQRSGGRSSLLDYYTAAYGAAVFDKRLRSRTVFAKHNLATDSAFAEMHLISCRNVLIYFNHSLKEQVIKLFDKSLVRPGFLGLGLQENLYFLKKPHGFMKLSDQNRIYQIRAALNRDGSGSNRAELINTIDCKEIVRDAGGKPLHNFPHPALAPAKGGRQYAG